VKEKLNLAFQYLTVKDALPFAPNFLTTNNYEEVIFQSTKALDSFLSAILNKRKHFHRIKIDSAKNFAVDAPTLGDKISHMRSYKDVRDNLGERWLELLSEINRTRNINSHEEKIVGNLEVSDNGRSISITNLAYETIQLSNAEEEENAKKMMSDILYIIEESYYLLDHNG
jgi:hypothetical protein